METNDKLEQLVGCLVQVVARAAIAEERVRDVVGTSGRVVRAFSLADGTRTLSDIAKKANLDRGNLSRAAKRWVENGIAFWIGDTKDAKLLHAYPLPAEGRRKTRKPRAGRKGRRPHR